MGNISVLITGVLNWTSFDVEGLVPKGSCPRYLGLDPSHLTLRLEAVTYRCADSLGDCSCSRREPSLRTAVAEIATCVTRCRSGRTVPGLQNSSHAMSVRLGLSIEWTVIFLNRDPRIGNVQTVSYKLNNYTRIETHTHKIVYNAHHFDILLVFLSI